jgi:hypothetical protein
VFFPYTSRCHERCCIRSRRIGRRNRPAKRPPALMDGASPQPRGALSLFRLVFHPFPSASLHFVRGAHAETTLICPGWNVGFVNVMRVYAIGENRGEGKTRRRSGRSNSLIAANGRASGAQERRTAANNGILRSSRGGRGRVGEGSAGSADRKHVESGIHMQPREY